MIYDILGIPQFHSSGRLGIYPDYENNGWFLEDKVTFTNMKPRITEIEVYNRGA